MSVWLKKGEWPGWEPKGHLLVLKVSPLVGSSAQSYSALPDRNVQRSDSDRVTHGNIPYVTACCAKWCYSHIPLYGRDDAQDGCSHVTRM